MASRALPSKNIHSPHDLPKVSIVLASSLDYLLLGELSFFGYLMFAINCQLNVMWNHLGNILLGVPLRTFPKIFH